MDNRPRWIPWLQVGAIVAAIVLVSISLLVPAIRMAEKSARRVSRANDLAAIGYALCNFHDTFGYFPPAVHTDEQGRRLCSWRYRLLPFLEAIMLHVDYGDRWDDPANQWLSTGSYYCWYGWSQEEPFPQCTETNIVAITGPGTAFDGDRKCRRADLDADTILVIECAATGIHWMEPGDLAVDRVSQSIVRGVDGDSVLVLFADGAVWSLRSDVALDALKKFFTIEGAKEYDRDQLLKPHAHIYFPRGPSQAWNP